MSAHSLGISLTTAFVLSMLCPIHGSEPPAEWKKVDAKQFTFFIPPDIKPVPTRGIDSYVGGFRGTNIDLTFDYGPWSDPLNYKHMAAYATKALKIDGRDARLVSFYNPASGYRFDEVIAIHFRDLGDGGTKLTMWATCREKKHYAIVEQIFLTLRFNK